MVDRYKIQRLYFRNPETSSKTARSSAAVQRTRRMGPWFDCYTLES